MRLTMQDRLPWILSALLGAALLASHISHERRLDQLGVALGETEVPTRLSKGAKQPTPALSARVGVLEEQVSAMKRKRRAHRGQQAVTNGAEAATMRMEAAMAQNVQSAGGEQVLEVLESEDPEVRERLRDVIDDELHARRELRREERREQKKAHAEKMVQDLVTSHGISSSQAESLRGLLNDEHDQIRGFFEAARQDHSWGEARDKAQDLREENDAEASELLREDAYTAWQEQRDAEIERHYGRKRN